MDASTDADLCSEAETGNSWYPQGQHDSKGQFSVFQYDSWGQCLLYNLVKLSWQQAFFDPKFQCTEALQSTYQQLKDLGYPHLQSLDQEKLAVECSALDEQVRSFCSLYLTHNLSCYNWSSPQAINSKENLDTWLATIESIRQEHRELAFFTPAHVLKLYHLLQKSVQNVEDIARELMFLFERDKNCLEMLCNAVERTLEVSFLL